MLYTTDPLKYPTFQARLPNVPYHSLAAFAFRLYGSPTKVWMPYLKPLKDEDGVETGQMQFIFDRHPFSRSDYAREIELSKNFLRIGLIQGIQEGPWLIVNPDDPDCYDAVHWGARLRGVFYAWRSDPENEVLKFTLDHGVSDCTVLHPQIPDDAIRFLIGHGNIMP